MWVNREIQQRIETLIQATSIQQGECKRLEVENARLRADLDWFKLRLNSVEKERAQLIAAAIGVKISVPEFVPQTHNLEEAFNAIQDLSSVGGDAKEEATTLGQELDVDYSLMPGYRK
jgi:hypothetical protein